ncbi:hypothetical protein [Plantibacter sp. RU18]
MTALTSKTEPATAGYTTLWGTTDVRIVRHDLCVAMGYFLGVVDRRA